MLTSLKCKSDESDDKCNLEYDWHEADDDDLCELWVGGYGGAKQATFNHPFLSGVPGEILQNWDDGDGTPIQKSISAPVSPQFSSVSPRL